MQTRAVLVLLSILATLVSPFCWSTSVRQTYSHDLRNPSNSTDECEKKATPLHISLSVIGYLSSAFVACSPGMRVHMELDGHENVIKDKWFMAFLGITTLDYVGWVGYSFKKVYCDAAIFMILNSITGAVVSSLCALVGLVKERGKVAKKDDRVTLAFCFIGMGVAIGFGSYKSASGYYLLAATLVAHVCRFMSTDYTQASMPQMIVSLIGCVGGFLSIQHPDLAKAQPFSIAAATVAGIRGLELVWWAVLYTRLSPTPRLWLEGVRGWIARS